MKYQSSDLTIFKQYINQKFKNTDDVKVIFDIGACHALESVEFSKLYKNAKIYTFEANPNTYKICLENAKNYNSITVINEAINDFDGVCKFYPIDKEKTITTWEDGNQGASSLYKSNGAYDHIEKYVQYEIEIPCTRVDTFCKQHNITNIDIVWMDLQGAELKALHSMGDMLDNIKLIYTESEMNPMYEGQSLFSEVHQYLIERGFEWVWGNTDSFFGSDFIFINSKV